MTNNSGKFESVLYSHKSLDEQNPDSNNEFQDADPSKIKKETLTGMMPSDMNIGRQIPKIQVETISMIRFYLGQLWWLWIIAAVLYFANKK